MAQVTLQGLHKSFGGNSILQGIDLQIAEGEFVALVGPSGCGKSTCLRILAGLETPSSGRVFIDGQDVTELNPRERGVAMVFQSYALYPHMTVYDNLAFPLRMAKVPETEVKQRIEETSAMLGLEGLLQRKPSQLSGGQKQRVAMGRALIRKPKVLLFDEPLSNLDAQLRVKVRAEIAALHKSLRSTIIYVTHDQVEAMTLADRIAILNKGRLEQLGAPLEIYHRPETRFVAGFIGTPPMNFLSLSEKQPPFHPSTSGIGFRPEATLIGDDTTNESDFLALGNGTVTLIEALGSATHIHLKLHQESVIASLDPRSHASHQKVEIGQTFAVRVPKKEIVPFDQSGRRISESSQVLL